MVQLIAKPIVANRYWILKQDNQKVGEVEAGTDGYSLKLNGDVSRFKTLRMLKQRASIEFMPMPAVTNLKQQKNQVHGYQTDSTAHNPLYDIKHKIPVFTKNKNSKSWFAAGWYKVKQHSKWTTEFCPKVITLQRYPFQGPFHSKTEAEA